MELKPVMSRIRIPDVRRLVVGVGPGSTAHRLTKTIERQSPCVVILAGIAGAFQGSGLCDTDVCVADSERYGDLGRCTGVDVEPVILAGEDRPTMEFNLASTWQGIMTREELRDKGVHVVPMATVSCSSGNLERASVISGFTGASVENMEGAAAAQSCLSYGIPLIEIRAVSNVAGMVDMNRWNIKGALTNISRVVPMIINGIIGRSCKYSTKKIRRD